MYVSLYIDTVYPKCIDVSELIPSVQLSKKWGNYATWGIHADVFLAASMLGITKLSIRVSLNS